jgi:ribosomal-protein-alanine N-acetyltransferase
VIGYGEGEMQFIFRPMSEGDARTIAGWHYQEPYTFYDMDQDADDLAELLDPRSWTETYYAVVDEPGELVGFFAFKRDGDIVDLVLGLRPDLTGRGIGRWLLAEAERLAPAGTTEFLLYTGARSARNIRMYQRAGYVLSEAPPAGHPVIPGVVYLRKSRTS